MNATSDLNGSTALVTGATGFIGGHLVDRLANEGTRVHCLIRNSSDTRWLPAKGVKTHVADLKQPDSYSHLIAQSDYVFHCAGLTKARTRREFFSVNADTCKPFYKTCESHGKNLKAVIHLSSLAAVGPAKENETVNEQTACNPVTYYGKSKLAGEKIALGFQSTLPIVVLRPPVVYGEREKNFFTYLKALRQGWQIQVGHATRMLSIIHSDDLVNAMLHAALNPQDRHRVFFVTDGGNYSWDEVAGIASQLLKKKPRRLVIPESLMTFAALVVEAVSFFRKEAPLLDRQRLIDIKQSSWTASSKLFTEQTGFKPELTLEAGLKKTLDWYHQNGWM